MKSIDKHGENSLIINLAIMFEYIEKKQNLMEKSKTKFFSFFWIPHKKIWNTYYHFEKWNFKKSHITNDMLWDLIEISESIFNNLILEKQDVSSKNNSIIREIKFALYPEQIESKFLSLIQKFSNQKQILAALDFVKNKHEWQYRDENTPYWTHLVLTAIYIIENNWNENDVIIALLHDTIEDRFTPWVGEEIKNLFWRNILNWVIILSKIRNWVKVDIKQYYSEIKRDISLLRIKVCDRLANLYWTYFWPDIDWNMNYLFKTKKEIIPLIIDIFPELAEKMEEIINFLRENTNIPEEYKKRIEDLREIREIKEKTLKIEAMENWNL